MMQAQTSFRTLAQLTTSLTSTADGLRALSGMDLESPLVSLLELPPSDSRVPSLLVLVALSPDKVTCSKLVRDRAFLGLLEELAEVLVSPGSPYPQDELEYITCIVDRACCFPELASVVQSKLLKLMCLILIKAETNDAQLMAMRSITRCGFVNPEGLDNLPELSLQAVHFMMALTNCLKADGGDQSAAMRHKIKTTSWI